MCTPVHISVTKRYIVEYLFHALRDLWDGSIGFAWFILLCKIYGYIRKDSDKVHKNIERHTAHTIVSWPNTKQCVIVHTYDLMMIIRQSIYIYDMMCFFVCRLVLYWTHACAELKKINTFVFLSFLTTEIAQVLKIYPCGGQCTIHPE